MHTKLDSAFHVTDLNGSTDCSLVIACGVLMFCGSMCAESMLPLTYEALWNVTQSRAPGLFLVQVLVGWLVIQS